MSSWFAWTGRGRRRLRGAWLVLPGLLLSACGEADQTPAAAPPPPAVSVVEVEPQDVTPSSQFVGRVVAIDQVDLRARVQGFLEQRLFTEGQDVKKGDLLYVIEQPPFQAQVEEAQADVARAEASVAETKATLERVQEASTSGAVSKQEVDQALANDQRAQAEVLAAQAQLQIAQLNLSYTEITAPIDGRIGLTSYTVGNLVGPDSNVLATIVSENPIYVTFPVSSRVILEVRKAAVAAGQPDAFVVHAQLPDGTTYAHPGKINFLDIEADQTTDTITVRAEFPESREPAGRRRVPQRHGRAGPTAGAAGRAATGAAARSGGLLRAAGQRPGPGRAATDPARPALPGQRRGPVRAAARRAGDRRGHPEGPAGHEGAGDRGPAATERTRPLAAGGE